MSDLFDKQMYAQKENNLRGSHKLPQTHEKVCNENEKRNKVEEKNDARVNILLMEGSPL